MTKHGLEILLERVASWPEDAQQEFVRLVTSIESKHIGVYRLSEDERAAVRRGVREMHEGKVASDEEVVAVFRRYRS